MFEKSDLVPAEAASIGHVADGPASTDTSSRSLSRQDSRLTAMMDDQPDEHYWYDLRVCCWLSLCLQIALVCLRMHRESAGIRIYTTPIFCVLLSHSPPRNCSKDLVMGCASSYCACHLHLCSIRLTIRLTVLHTDDAKHKAGCL